MTLLTKEGFYLLFRFAHCCIAIWLYCSIVPPTAYG